MKFQRPKGTEDLFNNKIILYNNIVKALMSVAKIYNYQEIITPIFESTQLFLRAIGQETDIMEKEIYQFYDKSNRDLALRPEGTAGVIRAVIENKLYNNQKQTLKFFYQGTMYRYEQPQKGRKREFHQFGIEALGNKSYILDAEVILLALAMVNKLEIKNFYVNVNFFGSEITKQTYQKAVLKTLQASTHKLCNSCQKSINTNPLRVLDCKICQYNKLVLPKLSQFYNQAEKTYFSQIIEVLKSQKVNFSIAENLVRGLDYYNGIIFEINVDDDKLGQSQNTIVGGGRYDNLCQQLGVPHQYPAIGFAFGIERLMLLLQENPNFNHITKLNLYIISQYQAGLLEVLNILNILRKKQLKVDGNFSIYNDKQKSSLLKNNTDMIDNILILADENLAYLHLLKQSQRIKIIFQSNSELLSEIFKYIS